MKQEELDALEAKYPKIDLWLIYTQDPVTYEASLRAVCTDKTLADIYERGLKQGIQLSKEGEFSPERANRIVVVEKTDANHLYGERTMEKILDLQKFDKERAI
jgi:hypothetical protein